MNVKTVSVHYERKLNLGDFNSATVGVTLWADVSDDDDLNLCMGALWDMAKENVKSQIVPIKNPSSTTISQAFLGLKINEEQNANQKPN